MFNKILKNLSILKKFLFINSIFFTIIGLFTFIYIKNVQPNLIKKKSSIHIEVINNTIDNLTRLNVKFNEEDIRRFLFSTRFLFQNLDRVIFFDNELNYDVLDYFFRDWRENETIKMDRGVIKNFLKICESLLGSERELEVDVTSGYRTTKTNEKLRRNNSKVAKNSMHLVGRAIDFKVRNRSIEKLEMVAKKLTPGGLGIYSGFIHIDTGPYRRWKA